MGSVDSHDHDVLTGPIAVIGQVGDTLVGVRDASIMTCAKVLGWCKLYSVNPSTSAQRGIRTNIRTGVIIKDLRLVPDKLEEWVAPRLLILSEHQQ